MAARKRRRRSVDVEEIKPWRFIAFTDLHMSAATLDRSLQVLRSVREAAQEHSADVVFTGDFWDARGVLSVRHVVPLLEELKIWQRAHIRAVFIPGNHDQVSLDGAVHGVRIFDPFPNIQVATNRLLWPERKLAFIPWREDPAEQQAQFDLDGKGWTIFAHAEVEGATTNYGHRAPGRVMLSQIEAHARAAYLGHYHKRQQLGKCSWYLGNPYQKDFGEMADPAKGIALITQEQAEPQWIPLEGFPKHHRVTVGMPFDANSIAANDIVEVWHPPGAEEQARELSKSIVAGDCRLLPLKPKEEDSTAPPDFAMGLDQAVESIVSREVELRVEEARPPLPFSAADMIGIGREILMELPEARAVNPMSPEVKILSVESTDFCALKGQMRLDLEERGLLLIRGPIGSGKTALVDAVTWCLYGATSPRKAGSHTATFRGDEVIHDDADECSVVTVLRHANGSQFEVTRSKKRGKGQRVTIRQDGNVIEGSDHAELITKIIGIDYTLWRAVVSLGQGAVGNFVTDADTARKNLLSSAFGLDVCPAAQKLVRKRLRPLEKHIAELGQSIALDRRELETLSAEKYDEQAARWANAHENALSEVKSRGERVNAELQEAAAMLVEEEPWRAKKAQLERSLEQALAELSSLSMSGQQAELQSQLGAARAEKAVVERDVFRLTQDIEALQSGPAAPCPTCGRPMNQDTADNVLHEKRTKLAGLQRSAQTFDTKIRDLDAKLSTVGQGSQQQRLEIQARVDAIRGELNYAGEMMSRFAQLRGAHNEQLRALERAREEWRALEGQENPWEARAREQATKIEALVGKIAESTKAAAAHDMSLEALRFWDEAFGPKGIPVLVLRTVIYELEHHANRFLGQVLKGQLTVQLSMVQESLGVQFFELVDGEKRERRYELLSGGQRRCVELAFTPFALSEMIFSRAGVSIPLLMVDELTTHLGQAEKPLVCEALRTLNRDTVVVIDHDPVVQGEFDVVYELQKQAEASALRRAA